MDGFFTNVTRQMTYLPLFQCKISTFRRFFKEKLRPHQDGKRQPPPNIGGGCFEFFLFYRITAEEGLRRWGKQIRMCHIRCKYRD